MRQDFGAEPFIPKEFAIDVGAELLRRRLRHEAPDIPQEKYGYDPDAAGA
jgi:hypothetical protein